MQDEEWKDIQGYEGKYQVSNYGDIKKSIEIIHRPVVMKNLENKTIAFFRCIKEAGIITGITYQNIGEVCRGTRNTAGGYKWEYINKDKYKAITQEIV